jgi:hypothetical protein
MEKRRVKPNKHYNPYKLTFQSGTPEAYSFVHCGTITNTRDIRDRKFVTSCCEKTQATLSRRTYPTYSIKVALGILMLAFNLDDDIEYLFEMIIYSSWTKL